VTETSGSVLIYPIQLVLFPKGMFPADLKVELVSVCLLQSRMVMRRVCRPFQVLFVRTGRGDRLIRDFCYIG
jgi:hypothetical protein